MWTLLATPLLVASLGICFPQAQSNSSASWSNFTNSEEDGLVGRAQTLPTVREGSFAYTGEYSARTTLPDKKMAYELILEAAAAVGNHAGTIEPGTQFVKYHGKYFESSTNIVLTSGETQYWSEIYKAVDILGDTVLDNGWMEVGQSPFRVNVKYWGSPVLALSLKVTTGGRDLIIDNTGTLKVQGRQYPSAYVDFAEGSSQLGYVITALQEQIIHSSGGPLVIEDGSTLDFEHGSLYLVLKFQSADQQRWPTFLVGDVLRLLTRMRSYFFHQGAFDAFGARLLFTDSTGTDIDVGWIGFYQMLYPQMSALGNGSGSTSTNITHPRDPTSPSDTQAREFSNNVQANGTFSGFAASNSIAVQEIT